MYGNMGNKETINETRKLFIEPGNMETKNPLMEHGNYL